MTHSQLSTTAYRAMHKAQGGACLICDTKGELWVDHDHTTGRIRGLICPRCNCVVGRYEKGLFSWSVNHLEKRIIAYLGEQEARQSA
jgi:hypothetical protein